MTVITSLILPSEKYSNFKVVFQNHPQRYEKLICFQPYTAKLEGTSSNPARANEFFVGGSSVRLKTN